MMKGLDKFVDAGQHVNSEVKSLRRSAKDAWDDITVKCPSCAACSKAPPGAETFSCSACEAKIIRPGVNHLVDYHARRLSDAISKNIDDVLGQTKTLHVTVPEGVQGGQPMQVQITPNEALVDVIVPQGLTAGQTFFTKVPASATSLVEVPLEARQAPKDVPVAELRGAAWRAGPKTEPEEERSPDLVSDADPEAELSPGVSKVADMAKQVSLDVQLKTAISSVKREVGIGVAGLAAAWDNVTVKCPSCAALLQVPSEADASVFTCKVCNATINNPTVRSRLDYHVTAIGRRISRDISSAVDGFRGVTEAIKVTPPPGAKKGDTIAVQVGIDGPRTSVVMPEDFDGETFVAHVPKALVEDDPLVYCGQLATTDEPVIKAEAVPVVSAGTATIVADDLGTPPASREATSSPARVGRPVARPLLSGGPGWLSLLKPTAPDSPGAPDQELKKGLEALGRRRPSQSD